MSNAAKSDENPFPVKAVTVFGTRADGTAKFAYMATARDYLTNYLKDYPASGGALALSGGHGSGKTFVLNWLSREAAQIKRRRPQTMYAKADDDSLPDVYRQFLRSVTREELIEVTRSAIHNIGKTIAASAQATQQVSTEIEVAGNLGPAFEEKIFDRNELFVLLKKELGTIGVSPAVSEQVAYAIGLLEHPDFGESAFAWLLGGEPALPKQMPIQGALWTGNSTDAADIAGSALECIAKLYQVAERPLILIIDQMENFIPQGQYSQTQASLLKKLAEQVSAQGALLLMAGTPPTWDRLPRDVGPRLINRAPLSIGSLNADETDLLLNTYLRTTPGFQPDTVSAVLELSGGNPREILRIAHEAFTKVGRSVTEASRSVLIEAAQESGSLADRAILALQMIDAATERFNLSSTAASTNEGNKIHRMITAAQGARLAIILLTSADARSEAEDARKLTDVRKQLASEENPADLFVVTIGYSSPQVRALVREISKVVEFNESTFREDLENQLRRLSMSASRDAKKEAAGLSPLLEQLVKLDTRLARIEATRSEAERETAESLQQGTAQLAEAQRVQTEIKTRFELREGLDELHSELLSGGLNGLDDERRTLRRLLVANEANVKDATFDYLGTLYLDALDGAQTAFYQRPEGPAIFGRYSRLRSDLIRTIRAHLSSWRRAPLYLITRVLFTVFGATCGAALVFLGLVYFARDLPFFLTSVLVSTLVVFGGAVSGVIFWLLREAMDAPQWRYRRFVREINSLRTRNASLLAEPNQA
jgi:hypothetical protein